MKKTHTHHIIPRHQGGSDDPSNLVELTIEEHAEAHRILFEKYGRLEDQLAWKGLLGHVGKEEIILQLKIEGAKRGGRTQGKIQGAINAITGFIHTIATPESRSKAGKISMSGKNKHIHSAGGKAASKVNLASGQIAALSRKVISLDDGRVISYNNKHHHEKKTGYKHIWVEL